MQRFILLGASASLSACLNQPNFVSISPDFGYFDNDGCYPVELQGNRLGTTATAAIGDAEITELTPAENDTAFPEQGQDVGFSYTGLAPASPSGKEGWFDVSMTVDGEKLELKDGWYYRTCPGPYSYDSLTVPGADTSPPAEAAVGDAISIEGCGIDERLQIQFIDPTGEPAVLPGATTGGTATGTPPTGTATGTPTGTATGTPTGTATGTPTGTATGTPTGTATGTPTGTGTTTSDPLCLGSVVATVSIVNDCPGGIGHVDIPQMDPGTYYVRLIHPDVPPDVGPCGIDSGDTGVSCDCRTVIVGGAK